ncbi:MAG: hypothetical protein GXY35_02330 [Chlamydiae bacterium]|nr:hypothetical protein [Chlamydiota bacterium]
MNDNGGKALIIGGEAALRRMLVGLCGELGLSARGAATRDEAGEELRRQYQDLIILCDGVR